MEEEKNLLAMLMQGVPVRVVNRHEPEHYSLSPDEKELAEALIKIAERHGKFNEDYKGVWAGYESAASNTVARIGVKCANCVLYSGGDQCKIILNPVEPEGKCRFAVIPDGVVKKYMDGTKSDSIESKAAKKCPEATQDIAVNLRNRKSAIDKAMYGPLNPAEPNNDYWKKLSGEWDVSPAEAKKQLCGNCAVFVVTPEMKGCIESGLTGGRNDDEWEAIDAAGELGYCEAFDFKCASKRTCRAWVGGGPIRSEAK
jgi:hypothetical protein